MNYQGSRSSSSKRIPELLDDLGYGDGTAQNFRPVRVIIANTNPFRYMVCKYKCPKIFDTNLNMKTLCHRL